MESKEPLHQHNTRVKKVDRLSPTRIRLTIEMPSTTVRNHEDNTTQAYARKARLPGFRPGKAPVAMVKQKFKEDIRRDVVSHLLEAGIGDALQSTKLNPLNRPSVELVKLDFDDGGFEFAAEFEVRPEIELKSYRGIRIPKSNTEPTPKEVAETLENIRERFATLDPLETDHLEKAQYAIVKLSFETLEEPTHAEPPKQYTLQVGVGKLLPEIDAALLAAKVGVENVTRATFPIDYSEKSLAGKQADFKFKILEVKKKSLPELNDDLAKQAKENATLASLKEDVVASLTEGKKRTASKKEREGILKHLVEKNPFEVPQSLVEKQAAALIQSIQEDMKSQGYPFPKLTDEDLKSVKARAEHLVRGSLLLHEVALKENITVDDSRCQQRVANLASQFQRPSEEMQKMLDGKGMSDRIRDDVQTDQVFEFLIQNAVIEK